MNKAPNFIVVGAAKSGTTSLFHYLNQHPDVFIPDKKECRFFSQMPGGFKGPGDEHVNETIVRTYPEYLGLFKEARSETALGDVSPDYMYYYQNSIKNIKEALGSVKIIIVLRNPVYRAFSQYMHFRRDGRETLSFEDALAQEESRQDQGWEWAWSYTKIGFYYPQVKAFLDAFGREHVRVYLYERFNRNPMEIIGDIFNFIGVYDTFEPDTAPRFNVTRIPKSESTQNFLNDFGHPIKKILRPILLNTIGSGNTERLVNYFKQKNLVKLNNITKKKLVELYRDDILKLGALIERDLSHWLN